MPFKPVRGTIEISNNQARILVKIIFSKKKRLFDKIITENMTKPKQLWQSWKSLDKLSKWERQSKISLKENGLVSFYQKHNKNIFHRFFSSLTDSLLKKILPWKVNLESKPLKNSITRFEMNVRTLFYTRVRLIFLKHCREIY